MFVAQATKRGFLDFAFNRLSIYCGSFNRLFFRNLRKTDRTFGVGSEIVGTVCILA